MRCFSIQIVKNKLARITYGSRYNTSKALAQNEKDEPSGLRCWSCNFSNRNGGPSGTLACRIPFNSDDEYVRQLRCHKDEMCYFSWATDPNGRVIHRGCRVSR
ncbi:DgyrCDS13448 [Dimorphilus gyrociliatus]|uniref:DgyrCDS13448 n=1 Tax=Dimorphilus gyrociliatus TaxID=2664684 RepID=A0A7I8WAP5_9ANNE|nr:DgyrCDS13448 [Dimorphilus gyrociliatus]